MTGFTEGVYTVGLVVLAVSLLQRLAKPQRLTIDTVLLPILLLAYNTLRLTPLPVDVLPQIGQVASSLVPFALCRLVRAFRPVHPILLVMSLIAGVTGSAAPFLVRPASTAAWMASWPLMAVVLLACFPTFVSEARRSAGVRRNRLRFAAAGTAAILLSIILVAIGGSTELLAGLGWMKNLTRGMAFILFALAFLPPRWLVDRWRWSQHTELLAEQASLAHEERGRRAPDDLFKALVRSANGVLTLVAIRDESTGRFLVTSADRPDFVGASLESDVPLDELAPASAGVFVRAASLRCGPRAPAHFGDDALVVPIGSTERTWGFAVVVYGRSAFLVDGDPQVVEQLCRTAALAFEHAALIAQQRERERAEAHRRLREVETRLDLILASIKDYAMLALDAEGRVASWQAGAEHMFDYPAGDVAGRSAASLYATSDAQLHDWLGQARSKGAFEFEGTCCRRDGTTFVGATTIRPLIGDNQNPGGFVVVTGDVTVQRSLEERLREGQKLEAIGRLAGGVAHHFNNLLAAILGHAEWLERELADDPRVEEAQSIQAAAERAAELTQQLLTFSRRHAITPTRVNLGDLAATLLPTLRRIIPESVHIVDATTARVPQVLGDPGQLEQVIMNLVVNARDAMPTGGTLTVRTAEVWREGREPGTAAVRHVLLEVSDTGLGMDPDTVRKAFEPYFTTKPVGQGTGLGLATVYGTTQQLGGHVQIQSEIGHGTSVQIYIPENNVIEHPERLAPLESLLGPDTLM